MAHMPPAKLSSRMVPSSGAPNPASSHHGPPMKSSGIVNENSGDWVRTETVLKVIDFQMSLEEATAATYVTVRVVLDAPIASSASPTLMVTKPWILRTSPDSVFASAREAIEASALRFSSERSSALEDVVHRLSTGRGKHRCLPSLLLNPIAFALEN